MRQVKFGDIKLNDVSKKHVMECLESNRITMGQKVEEFENKFAKLFGYKYAVATSSGTTACMAALMALYEIRKAKIGDEVIVPALSFIATANAIRAAGFTPVFVDVEPHTMNIDISKIEEKITDKTIAIMCVSLMGKPCDLDPILEISNQHKLSVIHDCCEAHGAKYKYDFVGNHGELITCFSFYTAHLIFSGEMGMCVTSNHATSNILRAIRTHGRHGLYFQHDIFGLNFKPTDIHAAIGLGEIDNFWPNFIVRKGNLYYLQDKLSKYKNIAWFTEEEFPNVNSPHAFSMTFKPEVVHHKGLRVYNIISYLQKDGLEVKRNFGSMPCQHKCFQYLNNNPKDFPNAEHIGLYGFHIGVHQYLTHEDLDYAIETISSYIDKVLK